MDNIAQIEESIKFAEEKAKHFQELIKRYQEELNILKRDTLSLVVKEGSETVFLIECNYASWKYIKDNFKSSDRPFYLSIQDDKEYAYIGLSVEEAKTLRDYLTQKIDYLESEEEVK